MKSERRHELEQNVLADRLTTVVEGVRPYTNIILGLLLLAAIAAVAGTWWVQKSAAESSAAWDAYYNALAADDPEELAMVSEAYPDAEAARWAEAVAGDLYLGRGCDQLFSNRAEANLTLDKAAEFYTHVLNRASEAVLLERATYGLARTREAMGDLKPARNLYEKVTQEWPKGPFAGISARRLKELQEPLTLVFYDKFEKFDPQPAFADEPGTPGVGPLFDEGSLLSPQTSPEPGDLPNLDLENVGR